MRVLVTGLRGTVGRALGPVLAARGHDVLGWDRATVPADDPASMEQLLRFAQPHALIHLAIASTPTGLADEGRRVNILWPDHLAGLTRDLGIRLVHVSTVMVFRDTTPGPYPVDAAPDADTGYGLDKREAEERVREANPGACVARIGWQIGETPGSNNMIDFLETRTREDGAVRASRRWIPACSFLADTADTLAALTGDPAATGVYQVDGNPGWNFHEIATALSARHGNRWPVEPTEDFVHDQRMLDPRVSIAPLSQRLPSLPTP